MNLPFTKTAACQGCAYFVASHLDDPCQPCLEQYWMAGGQQPNYIAAKKETPKLCKTCKHWKLDKAWEPRPRSIGHCNNVLVMEDALHHGCAPSYQIRFTLDFGCIHHEEKEV
jgi:hypothetical protein